MHSASNSRATPSATRWLVHRGVFESDAHRIALFVIADFHLRAQRFTDCIYATAKNDF